MIDKIYKEIRACTYDLNSTMCHAYLMTIVAYNHVSTSSLFNIVPMLVFQVNIGFNTWWGLVQTI